jgi:hypothetical protein
MPGLLRGVARTAVIAGTATAVSGRVQRRQNERFVERDARAAAARDQAYADQYAQEAPVVPRQATEDRLAQLERLSNLLEQGALSQEEFAAEKARILQS